MLIRLRALISDLPSQEAFLATYGSPALVLEPFDAGDGSTKEETPAEGYATEVRAPANLFAGGGLEGGGVHPEAQVAWLVKSPRNPILGLISVGRGNNNDVILPHSSVSKVHTIFSHTGEDWFVEDRRSTNGTFLDGVRLPPGERHPVDDGSSIRIGDALVARFFRPASLFEFCRLIAT